MRRPVPPHRAARHHLLLHRPPLSRPGPAQTRSGGESLRLADLILALLGVALLGGFALMAATALMGRTPAP